MPFCQAVPRAACLKPSTTMESVVSSCRSSNEAGIVSVHSSTGSQLGGTSESQIRKGLGTTRTTTQILRLSSQCQPPWTPGLEKKGVPIQYNFYHLPARRLLARGDLQPEDVCAARHSGHTPRRSLLRLPLGASLAGPGGLPKLLTMMILMILFAQIIDG